MKKVKAIVSFATVDAGYMAGDIFETQDDRADEYIDCGYCVPEEGEPGSQGESASQGEPGSLGESDTQGEPQEKEGEADAVRGKDPAGAGTNKPHRHKAAPKG